MQEAMEYNHFSVAENQLKLKTDLDTTAATGQTAHIEALTLLNMHVTGDPHDEH